jgi:hypothetical protein
VNLQANSAVASSSFDTLFRFVNTPSDYRAYVYRYNTISKLTDYNSRVLVQAQTTRVSVPVMSNVATVPL